MCILGAVMLDYPVIQPLTGFEWMLSDPNRPNLQVYKLARMLNSLLSSSSALISFYDNLKRNEADATRFYPYPRHFELAGNATGFRFVRAVSSDKLVYHALAGSGVNKRAIVVKFVKSYHAEAHRLLADAHLAPALLFVSSGHGLKIAGLSMIVMEKVKGISLAELKTAPQCVGEKVSDALKRLHERGIVFGDLQHSNVMAVLDDQKQVVGGMLVDFDWCGKDGEEKYPVSLNSDFEWPAGVGMGTTMRVEHNWEMFEKMFSS